MKLVLGFTSVMLDLGTLLLTSCARHWSPQERVDWVTKQIAKH